jgi:type I restriction enzyme R subunit
MAETRRLADLARFAEPEDPATSLIEQRSFVEHVVTAVYAAYRLPPYSHRFVGTHHES